MIGIIGGTGLYRMDELQVTETRSVDTPFGAPSAPIVLGTLGGRSVAFLARHGVNHELLPGEINYRANVWALKSVGVRTIVGVSAVGSLREEIRPGDLALPAQYIDFTRGVRAATFFGRGLVAHVSTAQPTCRATARLIAEAARGMGLMVHEEKTYACVEGPRFGTRAESFFLRSAGADIVGMTNVPEAFLACEAQLGYCTIAVVTDYDCWMDDPAQHVAAETAMAMFHENLARVQQLLVRVVAGYSDDESRPCRHTLRGAIVTPRERMTEEQRALVDFLSS
ncbi:MAG: S-methyl-5'-thioadenosine phosphorylase [Pseudomonadota bacterium]|jgi:5''-deoxy-5''-methylthioadenosine phosphorylase|nr:MAG: 5'-methylthioadenosine phosphorylase [Pseudomonadota bacterium]